MNIFIFIFKQKWTNRRSLDGIDLQCLGWHIVGMLNYKNLKIFMDIAKIWLQKFEDFTKFWTFLWILQKFEDFTKFWTFLWILQNFEHFYGFYKILNIFYGYYKNLKIFMDIKCADSNIRCEYFNNYRFEQKL